MSQSNEVVIEAGRSESLYWKDIWRYRELCMFFLWRDVLVRYKQTVIGAGWSVIRPFVAMIVFTVIFGRLAKFPSEGAPYAILVFSALLPWQMFANALVDSSNSLISNASMLSKVYFPRLIMPVSAVMISLVDFLISFAVLGILMIWYGFAPDWRIITVPFFLLLAISVAFGSGIWLAALNVKYRDFRYVVPFLVQFGMYVSPVGFSSNIVPEKWRLIYSLNPMVGVIDGFRWAILGDQYKLYLPGFIVSIGLALIVFWLGINYFRKAERTFADVI